MRSNTDNSSRNKVSLCVLLMIGILLISGCGMSNEAKYKNAVNLLSSAKYDDALEVFSEIEQYEDSSIYIMYIKALKMAEGGEYALASLTFETMSDFRDSKYLSIYYSARQAEKDTRYKDADALYRTISTFSDSADRINALHDLILEDDFNSAIEGLYDGNYSQDDREMISAFVTQQYNDSDTRMLQDIYEHANALLNKGYYPIAYELFSMLNDNNFSDSERRIKDCHYAHVQILMQDQKYSDAYSYIQTHLTDYSDVTSNYKECCYHLANEKLAVGKFKEACALYQEADDYADAAQKIQSLEETYQAAIQLMGSQEYKQAYDTFVTLNDYSDSKDKATECYYNLAKEWLEEGEYKSAKEAFESLGDYSNAVEMVKETQYQWATFFLEQKDYFAATMYFTVLGDYRDSTELAQKADAQYQIELAAKQEARSQALDFIMTVPDNETPGYSYKNRLVIYPDGSVRLTSTHISAKGSAFNTLHVITGSTPAIWDKEDNVCTLQKGESVFIISYIKNNEISIRIENCDVNNPWYRVVGTYQLEEE